MGLARSRGSEMVCSVCDYPDSQLSWIWFPPKVTETVVQVYVLYVGDSETLVGHEDMIQERREAKKGKLSYPRSNGAGVFILQPPKSHWLGAAPGGR